MIIDVYLDLLINYVKIKLYDWYYILLVIIKNFEVILIVLQFDVIELDNWVMLLINSLNFLMIEGMISGLILEQFIFFIILILYELFGLQNIIYDIFFCFVVIDLNL